MRRAIYVLGLTGLFALLGYWYSQLGDSSALWTTAMGAAVGFALGAAFRQSVPSRKRPGAMNS
jgi:hypothetical protein